MKYYIGIDNGITGSITILTKGGTLIHSHAVPITKQLSYTKKKQKVSRIDVQELKRVLLIRLPLKHHKTSERQALVVMERPLVNPGMFKATLSGIRALEATLIVLESLNLPYQYIDSKEWQKALLPSGCKGSAELKAAAIDIAKRLYPKSPSKTADSVLIAEYARRKRL